MSAGLRKMFSSVVSRLTRALRVTERTRLLLSSGVVKTGGVQVT